MAYACSEEPWLKPARRVSIPIFFTFAKFERTYELFQSKRNLHSLYFLFQET